MQRLFSQKKACSTKINQRMQTMENRSNNSSSRKFITKKHAKHLWFYEYYSFFKENLCIMYVSLRQNVAKTSLGKHFHFSYAFCDTHTLCLCAHFLFIIFKVMQFSVITFVSIIRLATYTLFVHTLFIYYILSNAM